MNWPGFIETSKSADLLSLLPSSFSFFKIPPVFLNPRKTGGIRLEGS
jgi:hypothetical protein